MTGDCHAPFCGSPGAKFPRATRHCKDTLRRLDSEQISFTFLGFTFRPRAARRKDGSMYVRFLPAISKDALKKISAEVRSWRLHRRVSYTFAELATSINPVVAGWMQYYGRFRRSALSALLARINAYLVRWIRKKYKRLQGTRKAHRKLREITARYSRTGNGSPQPGCDQGDKSRMNREVHVRILWEPGGEIPPGHPTRRLSVGSAVIWRRQVAQDEGYRHAAGGGARPGVNITVAAAYGPRRASVRRRTGDWQGRKAGGRRVSGAVARLFAADGAGDAGDDGGWRVSIRRR